MLRSLMTAVTGVRAHQTMLDVTGNNIANVNTTGFKKDFTVFQDLLYQTTKSASGPGDNRGGVDPSQVGLGVQVAAIETNYAQGAAQYTGNKSDMMISGEGFFVFRDGQSRIYSRAGNFIVDANLNLVHSGTGYNVQGYVMERDPLNPMNFIRSSELTDINIPMGKKMEARATTIVGYQCNLDSRSDVYLPIGYADIPFTSQNKDAQVKLNGVVYDTGFKTDLSSADGTGYLTITIDAGTGQPAGEIVFDMIGIENGLPVLSAQSSTVDLNGTNPPETANVLYDNETGVFKLVNGDGSTIWETNLQSNMTYASFSVTDNLAATTYNFIGEFSEGNLDGSPTTLTLWYEDPASPGAVQSVTATVSFKADGSFDSVTPIDGTLPGNLTSDNLQIQPTSSGQALEILIAKDLSAVNPTVFDTAGQITMGGFRATKIDVYDCKGDPYTLEVQFKKISENRWRWEAFFPNNPELAPTPASGEITFGPCGEILSPDSVDIYVPFSLLGSQNQTITLDFSGKSFGLDKLSGITQYASETTTKPYYQDGYTMGVLEDYSVSQDGTINGIYTNGQTMPIYRIALAQFANPMGLEKIGNTMFRETVNSGTARIDAALTDGAGYITQYSLEASNVDLTEEFTHLIIAQRGFQANTRVVTVSDQILEEVVNMKR